MSDKKKHLKALKEIEETRILVDFLVAHDLDFELLENFSDQMVRRAVEWANRD